MTCFQLQKEEIAKEFDNLPERKSKIATILKDENVAYCICRSSDSSRFMICCDFCEEWYHGDCIRVTEKVSKAIKKYYCDRCREADPTLKTVVKTATQQPQQSSSAYKDKDVLKKKKDKSEARCGHCDGCRSRAAGKKGKCEKRLSSYQLKKKEKKIKEGRVK